MLCRAKCNALPSEMQRSAERAKCMICAGRAQSLHILLRNKETSPQELLAQVADTGGDFSIKGESGNAGTKVISYYRLPKEESIRDRVNTLFVVATLVATVTFAAAFAIPGGYNNSGPQDGMATLLTKYILSHLGTVGGFKLGAHSSSFCIAAVGDCTYDVVLSLHDWVVFTPLFFETTSRFRIIRYITYYPFCMEVLASQSHNDDQEED
ncbi:unnamed protein product [Prunus armeniaca]|uniref:PGG domain-containing protein n=1 Tax=Prunus armeniaca TaxID=36596 RepID=A0A6J5XJ91_PRUAR|nr:unnamed protein product [Prunus armeniaca]CAB4311078.1 unnamed protein product [Prunus armeniaca]